MDVSVVVYSYSLERHYLLDTIPSLNHHLHPFGEIIVVIDKRASLDHQTASDATAYDWHKEAQIQRSAQQVAHAKNVGIRESSGAVIAFIDNHAIADPNWIPGMIESFAAMHASAR